MRGLAAMAVGLMLLTCNLPGDAGRASEVNSGKILPQPSDAAILPGALTRFGATRVAMLDGSRTMLRDLVAERPAIIALWSSACVPCRTEARQLLAIRAQVPPARLAIIYANPIAGDANSAAGKRFLEQTGGGQLAPVEMAYDDAIRFTRLSQLSMPRVMFFDAMGRPRAVVVGGIAGPLRGPAPVDKRLMRALAMILP